MVYGLLAPETVQTSGVNEATLTANVESEVAATDWVEPVVIELLGANVIVCPGNMVVVRVSFDAAFQSSFPDWEAVIEQDPDFKITKLPSLTVHTSVVELV